MRVTKYVWEEYDDPLQILDDPVHGYKSKQWLVDLIPEGNSVVDIGGGIGILYGLLSDRRYVLVDIEPALLDQAKVLFPNIEAVQADMNFLPFQDNSFDTAILFTSLEMVPDFRKAVDEAFRVAKRVVITLSIEPIEGPDENAFGVQDPPVYGVRINRNHLTEYLQQFGVVEQREFIHEGITKYWWWIV